MSNKISQEEIDGLKREIERDFPNSTWGWRLPGKFKYEGKEWTQYGDSQSQGTWGISYRSGEDVLKRIDFPVRNNNPFEFNYYIERASLEMLVYLDTINVKHD